MQATVKSITSSKPGEAKVVLAFNLAHYSEIFRDLGLDVGDDVLVTFEPVARQLSLDDDPNENVPAAVPPKWETEGGDVVTEHGFMGGRGDGTCGHCGFAETHAAHSAFDPIVEKLLAETQEDTSFLGEPTEEQAEAREALASRSKASK